MIDLGMDGVNRGLDLAVVNQVVAAVRDVAFNDYIDPEGMAMHAAAFVPFRHVGQEMGGFEVEAFHELDDV